MIVPLAALHASELLNVIWVSLTAGVGITFVFSLVVLGGGRSAEARRTGRGRAAGAYAALASLAFLAFAVGVGFGVQIMLSK